tara:strand:- start:2759 stop:3601 length:843 start_codon:yes stop_codon:yes gene_type:complete
MSISKIKSYAKINLSLNITGKTKILHKIESIIAFINLYDLISIKRSRLEKHKVSFIGKFSNKICRNNTVIKLLKILEKKKLIEKKFHIIINKKIPNMSGLGGGSMNAATILRYFMEKKIIKIKEKEANHIAKLIGSDVILGFNNTKSILTSKNKILRYKKIKNFYTLILKTNINCSTKEIFKKVRNFEKPKLNKPSKKMFNLNYLKKMTNSLEPIVFSKYPKLKKVKSDLENLSNPDFVRMTGSGSAIVAYYQSKDRCDHAKKRIIQRYRKCWCITTKTI